ncbi:hypothetical protein [Methylocella silvestris]|uniref:hypothetical protein n=1 Tax=Methylocella silvestris TaxID=199596 RepID=UPI0011D0F57D|nr:hypothetical protein [Methylocella silvestris]
MKFASPIRIEHELLAWLAVALAAGAAARSGEALGVDLLHAIGASLSPRRRPLESVGIIHARLPVLFYLKERANLNPIRVR